MKKLYIPILLLIGISMSANAQEKLNKGFKVDKPNSINFSNTASEKSSEEIKGNKYTFNYTYNKAIISYNNADMLTLEGKRRLAESYHFMKQNKEAEAIYLDLINLPQGVISEDFYNYAMVLKSNQKYDLATICMEKFKALKPTDLRAKSFAANNAELKNILKDWGKYRIDSLNINTTAKDFGTCFYKDKIIFASTRAVPKMFKHKDNWKKKPYFDMYIAEVEKNQLVNPEVFNKEMNGKLNDGPASFSNDGNFMAFSRNNYKDKSKDWVVEIQIYFSTFSNNKWTEPEPFVLNNQEYSVGQPCLTSDGNTMYFTSDMPGGLGGADIYRIHKSTSGAWGLPENLGDKINTEGNEMFPFYEEKNKVLFFASDGLYGLGGLDIFISTDKGNGFDSVKNAGYPLNTEYDDFALIIDNKLKKGYFSSDRKGGKGSDDIYAIEFRDELKPIKATDITKNDSALQHSEIVVVNSNSNSNSNSDVSFTVASPTNIPTERRVRETFPIRNYVFFDAGTTDISYRYVLLKKNQVKDFKEDQLEVFTPKELSGRSKRQMIAYYNILNILGDRMGKNPNVSVRLTGASMEGEDDAIKMAESVKKYLVTIFGIKATRIKTEGRIKPRDPSEKKGFKLELDLLREGDRRVTIWSESPELLMEFQSGPDAPLKPVILNSIQEAPLNSYVVFNVVGGIDSVSSWSLEIIDEKGKIQNFGPYDQEVVGIPGKSILGSRAKGDYKIKMKSKTKSGNVIQKETSAHMVLWTAPTREQGMRFSIIYEFNESKAISIYEKYLTDIVIPKIPKDAMVIVSGYTDIIGFVAHNQKLSLARANDVKGILEKGLKVAGRSDVKFEVYGFGEDANTSPFDNKYPEERFYNRTVIIDIIPNK